MHSAQISLVFRFKYTKMDMAIDSVLFRHLKYSLRNTAHLKVCLFSNGIALRIALRRGATLIIEITSVQFGVNVSLNSHIREENSIIECPCLGRKRLHIQATQFFI